jgi:hypothetical protein
MWCFLPCKTRKEQHLSGESAVIQRVTLADFAPDLCHPMLAEWAARGSERSASISGIIYELCEAFFEHPWVFSPSWKRASESAKAFPTMNSFSVISNIQNTESLRPIDVRSLVCTEETVALETPMINHPLPAIYHVEMLPRTTVSNPNCFKTRGCSSKRS